MIFFFQAEDGIRDRNVTGVQTCALPICRGGAQRALRHRGGTGGGRRGAGAARAAFAPERLFPSRAGEDEGVVSKKLLMSQRQGESNMFEIVDSPATGPIIKVIGVGGAGGN